MTKKCVLMDDLMHQRFDYKEINNWQIFQNVTIVKILGIKKSKC